MAKRVASRYRRAAALARGAVLPTFAATVVGVTACTALPSPPPARNTPSSGPGVAILNPEIAARLVYRPAAPMQIPRFGFAYASTGDRAFAFGGATSRALAMDQAGMTDTIEMYDALSDTWSIVGKLPAPRFGAAAGVMPTGAIMIAGGIVKIDGKLMATGEAFIFNPGTYQITQAPRLPWKAWGMSVIGTEKGFLATGGLSDPPFPMSLNPQINPLPKVFGDSALFAPSGGKWETMGELPLGRALSAAGISGGVPVLVTGRRSVLTQSGTNPGPVGPGGTLQGTPPNPSGIVSPEADMGPGDGDVHYFDFLSKTWWFAGAARSRPQHMYGAMTAQAPDGFAILGGIDPGDQLLAWGYIFKINPTPFNNPTISSVVLRDLPAKTALGGAAFIVDRLMAFGGLSETTALTNRSPGRSVTGDTWILRELNPQAQPASGFSPIPGTSNSPGSGQ